ncbi:hypothetical protein A3F66_03310 [candidate division TM6 bacterium RIFCSPHIGHO2_12_FULL_32_22]|nr:MAG: hypothetical protein A3F66_03310 [candidate division TM6 bacterium RIFCSPHIGHO2_12_FULL_32_22]
MKKQFLLFLSIFALSQSAEKLVKSGCLKPSFSVPLAPKLAVFSTDSRIVRQPEVKPVNREESYHIKDLIFSEINESKIVSICQFLDNTNLDYFLNSLVDLQDTHKAAEIFYKVYYRAKKPEKYFIAYRYAIINFLELHEKIIIEMLTRNMHLNQLDHNLRLKLKREALREQSRRNEYKPAKMKPFAFKASNESITRELVDHSINSIYSSFDQVSKQSACTLL